MGNNFPKPPEVFHQSKRREHRPVLFPSCVRPRPGPLDRRGGRPSRTTDARPVRFARIAGSLARLQLELAVAPHSVETNRTGPTGISVNIVRGFAAHAENHYRTPDGTTGEVREYKLVIRQLRTLYGIRPVAEFGPLALKAVRQRLVESGNCRGVVNQRTRRMVRIFKWGVSEELVPAPIHQALATVRALQANRTAAPEAPPVLPVDDATVDATLPKLNRTVRAMVELQRYTGMRPGEVCRLRLSDIDRCEAIWVYPSHPAQDGPSREGSGRHDRAERPGRDRIVRGEWHRR